MLLAKLKFDLKGIFEVFKNFFDVFKDKNSAEIATVLSILAVAIGLVIFILMLRARFDVKALVFGAVTIALSFVLSCVKLKMAYGGSITPASMIPIIIFAYIYGYKEGAVIGLIYGLLQFLQDPYFISPTQFAFDYLFSFGAILIAGFFNNKKDMRKNLIIAIAIIYAVRFTSHTMAGLFFYLEWKVPSLPIFGSTDNMPGLVYSMLYNATYLIPDMLIAIAVAVGLFSVKSINDLIGKEIMQYNDTKELKEKTKKENVIITTK